MSSDQFSSRIPRRRRRVKELAIFLGVLVLLLALAWTATARAHPVAANPTPTPVPTIENHRIVGYYTEWDKGCSSCLSLAAVLREPVTDLIYAFASPTGDGCSLSEQTTDASTDFPVILDAKNKDTRLKVLLSIGGADAAHFAKAVATEAKINLLVANCMSLMRQYPGVFDGVDIDWEYPSNSTQKAEYTALIRAFRSALGPKAPVTAAVTPYFSIDWKTVAPLMSWVNLMTYDLHGAWDRYTDFLAPVNADPSDPQYDAANSVKANAETMIHKFGIPPAKILLGLPFYGRAYKGVTLAHHGLFQRFAGAYAPGGGDGTFMYSTIVNTIAHQSGYVTYGPNPTSHENWLFRKGSHKGIFISYDGPAAITAKAQLIKSLGLGGAMIWDVSFDTTALTTSLMAALTHSLNG